IADKRKNISKLLEMGELEDKVVQVEIEEQAPSMFDMLQGSGMEQMRMNMQDAFSQLMPSKKKKRKLPVKEARKVLIHHEAQKMIDMEEAYQEAVNSEEQKRIVFNDEIDKVAGICQEYGNVSCVCVQRYFLLIVERSSVMTKYGAIKNDHILYFAVGAFNLT